MIKDLQRHFHKKFKACTKSKHIVLNNDKDLQRIAEKIQVHLLKIPATSTKELSKHKTLCYYLCVLENPKVVILGLFRHRT